MNHRHVYSPGNILDSNVRPGLNILLVNMAGLCHDCSESRSGRPICQTFPCLACREYFAVVQLQGAARKYSFLHRADIV